LAKHYAGYFPESYEPALDPAVVYIGKHRLTDLVMDEAHSIGQLLLSPTRTYAPVLKHLLTNHFHQVKGLIHCSGGGQTKCLNYLPEGVRVVKNNLFEAPYIFELIQQCSGANNREMYQVFNMGCRLEIYCEEQDAHTMMEVAKQFGIDARIIGRVEAGPEKSVLIEVPGENLFYA
jgi:phosphoribosylformylglycinamidine cyclo-ligase